MTSLFFSSICSCTSRYVGTFCEHLNPCHASSGPRCQNGGTCDVDYSSAVPGFKCRCPIGYTASLCEISERNACESGPCQNGGTCNLKSLQDYMCSCAQGYTGELFTSTFCSELNQYQLEFNKKNVNGLNLNHFNRKFPFFPSLGKYCEKENLCASSPCNNGGTCISMPGGNFKCHCPKGFQGKTCSDDVEECNTMPCQHGGTCRNTLGSYQ